MSSHPWYENYGSMDNAFLYGNFGNFFFIQIREKQGYIINTLKKKKNPRIYLHKQRKTVSRSPQSLQLLVNFGLHDLTHPLPTSTGSNRCDSALALLNADQLRRQNLSKVVPTLVM